MMDHILLLLYDILIHSHNHMFKFVSLFLPSQDRDLYYPHLNEDSYEQPVSVAWTSSMH